MKVIDKYIEGIGTDRIFTEADVYGLTAIGRILDIWRWV